mgnify:CR=1 FL=1
MPTRREIQLEREKMLQEVYNSQIRVEILLTELITLLGRVKTEKPKKGVKK